MPAAIRLRLVIMMFVEYAIPGATLPVLSYYLMSRLGFSSFEASLVMAMSPLSAFIALPLATYIGDRYLTAERLLAVCHLIAAGFMAALVLVERFPTFVFVYFGYGLCFVPTMALTNTVAFHHARDARRDFGQVRLWGTVGWVAVAWIFGYLWLGTGEHRSERLFHALVLSAACSLFLGLYALTLPRSSVNPSKEATFIPKAAIRLFMRPSLMLLGILTIVTTLTHQFYYFGMGPFLSDIGFKDHHIMPSMSLGQVTEIACIGLVGLLLGRLGLKAVLVLSVAANMFRFAVFALGGPPSLILVGLSMHGLCYAFFYTSGFIYVNENAGPRTRAGAQQLYHLLMGGVGTLAGFITAGLTGRLLTDTTTGIIAYQAFWMVPFGLSVAVLLGLLLFFREDPANTASAE